MQFHICHPSILEVAVSVPIWFQLFLEPLWKCFFFTFFVIFLFMKRTPEFIFNNVQCNMVKSYIKSKTIFHVFCRMHHCWEYESEWQFLGENAWSVSVLFRRTGQQVRGTMSRDFFLQVFFMNHPPPSPWKKHEGHFEFFRKFSEIFASQGAPPVSTTPVANNGNNIGLPTT